MSKRKFNFEGFDITRQQTYDFGRSQPSRNPRLFHPSHDDDGDGDADIDNIDYADDATAKNGEEPAGNGDDKGEVDPLDAFMEGIHQEMRSAHTRADPPPKVDKYADENEEDDPVESFLRARKKDVGLMLAADSLRAGYDSDEEVYATAKAVDAGMVEYDSDDNPVVTSDRKRIPPILPLDHSELEYDDFNKDF